MAKESSIIFDEFDSYAHFGRYEGSRGAPSPRNVFLVGRSRERAHFLDLLYMKSGLGSYLVTGVRGVGKSSFVRHCVDTFARDVFERYCGSRVGRSYLDKACVFVGLSLPLALTFTLAPVLRGLWIGGTVPPPFEGLIALSLLLALLLLGASPFLYAYRTRHGLSTDWRAKMGVWRWVYFVVPLLMAGASVWGEMNDAEARAGIPAFWLMLPLEAIGLLVRLAVAYHYRRGDGLRHRESSLALLETTANDLTFWRELVLGSLSATLLATTAREMLVVSPRLDVGWAGELLMLGLAGVALPALILLEKLTLLQPARRMVFETAIHPIAASQSGPHGTLRVGAPPSRAEDASGDLGRAIDSTLFCAIFRRWLPVLQIKINLGLDRLSHALVVEAMLRGLHQQLVATFKQPFGALNLLRWLFGGAIWLYLLHLPLPDILRIARIHRTFCHDPTLTLLARTTSARLADIVVPAQIDIIWATLFATLLALLTKRLAILPHHAAARELSALLDSLSSRVVFETSTSQVKIGQAGIEAGLPLRKRSVQTDPRDPHSLEQAFLGVLTTIRRPALALVPGLSLNLPAPEAIFVFDELDKVGTTTTLLDPEPGAAAGYAKEERERSKKLQALLSDLKNLLGTAQARFIFVGGRNLHDEWLADEANRQPLLTNIFDAEIYLRSLLTDYESDSNSLVDATAGSWSPEGRSGRALGGMRVFTLSVRRYFDAQHVRAYRTWKQWRSTAGAGRRDHALQIADAAFVPGTARGVLPSLIKFPSLKSLAPGVALPSINEFFWDSFIDFLTFRSRGIPRRARLILETFIRPYDRVATLKNEQLGRPAQHVLFFSDGDRVRIESASCSNPSGADSMGSTGATTRCSWRSFSSLTS